MSDLKLSPRRLLLVRSAKILALIGIAFVLYPFIAGLLPTKTVADQRLRQWQREIDLSLLPIGELRIIEDWPGGPVGLYRRSQYEREGLQQTHGTLPDPADREQPAEYFIFHPVTGTRGCQVRVLPANKQPQPDIAWYGGFIDPCTGALFDTAGRVHARYGGDNQDNLRQPAYRYIGPRRIELLPPAGK